MHLPWRDVLPGKHPAGKPISTSLTVNEASALATLAEGQRVLEIGSAFGFSAVVMALGGAESILSVDPHTWCAPARGSLLLMSDHLHIYGVEDRVEVVVDTFFEEYPRLAQRNARFDLIFIDGDHSYDAVMFDIKNSVTLLEPEGFIACHDYMERCCCPTVAQALDEFFPGGPDYILDSIAVYQPARK